MRSVPARSEGVILTARDGVTDRVRGLDGGADDYLAKPFHLTELKARLRAIIRRSAGLATSQIMVGELTVDTKAKRIALSMKALMAPAGGPPRAVVAQPERRQPPLQPTMEDKLSQLASKWKSR